ncbi:MAG TPA: hypothetical protein VM368_04335 [Flavisolibacter sp.]|nr:hypothetical protein [Flavisolibacter sp.]
MIKNPNDPRIKQPENSTNEDLNLTNRDASLVNIQQHQQVDAPIMSDSADTEAVNDNLSQSTLRGDNIDPEYGDDADPTFEAL